MDQNILQEKVSLNAELKRCEAYLKDKLTELPEHLQTADTNVLSTQGQIKALNKRLGEIDKIEAREAAKQKKLVAKSLEKVMDMKDQLYFLREQMDKDVSSLYGTHKGIFFELSKTLSQVLLQHEPKSKS